VAPPAWPGAQLRRRILAGETLFGAWASLASPGSAELMGRAGLEWIVVDLEHGNTTESELLAHLTAIEASGSVALVRPPSG
jgi:2-keto-3-deoxy-L-rhamnonate aldolase RhmA